MLRLLPLAFVVLVPALAQGRPPPPDVTDETWEPPPASPPARSDATPAARPPSPLAARWRLEGGIGARFGSFRVRGASTGTAIPGHLDVGLRKDRLFVYAEVSLQAIDVDVDANAGRGVIVPAHAHGLVHRAGANVRYAFARTGPRDVVAELYVEGGLGVQRFRWDAGGVWTRPDLALGLGFTLWGAGDRQHGGGSVGLRVTLAPRDDVEGAPPACGGPCDAATPPTGWDRSFLLDLTMHFGR